MTTTRNELRTKLATLQARYDCLFAELAPKAQAASGRAKWTDGSVAAWLGVSTDCLRGMIVNNLDNFSVSGEGCTFVLLEVRDILGLLEFRGPRASEINFVLSELTAVASYLSDLDSDGSEP